MCGGSRTQRKVRIRESRLRGERRHIRLAVFSELVS